jgi:hypothetical protein
MRLEGTPSEQLPEVLGTGRSDIGFAFVSFSGREPGGRDADYIEWHSLDHRPEQHRLPGLRQSLRIVSTPACRAARAASEGMFENVDHVMTYLFTDADEIPGFNVLGRALDEAGRMPLRLPSIGYMTADFAGKVAAPRAVAGADVLPWRPSTGVYLIVEEGHASPAALAEVPGVAGVWWHHGRQNPAPYAGDSLGRQIAWCYLDADPVETAGRLRDHMRERWASGAVKGLLAAPFHVITPFEWDRHLP